NETDQARLHHNKKTNQQSTIKILINRSFFTYPKILFSHPLFYSPFSPPISTASHTLPKPRTYQTSTILISSLLTPQLIPLPNTSIPFPTP
ncbi:hypothetical protein, partial [Priestia megaterium]|uniref:hypothetical protein n=1 Tax=Priestia megaterium TaxID=1404 RepID=UPI001C99B080